MKNMNQAVDFLNEIITKFQSFAGYYILKILEYGGYSAFPSSTTQQTFSTSSSAIQQTLFIYSITITTQQYSGDSAGYLTKIIFYQFFYISYMQFVLYKKIK
ncbi:unnamed protein product [Cunninghamella echinulata]